MNEDQMKIIEATILEWLDANRNMTLSNSERMLFTRTRMTNIKDDLSDEYNHLADELHYQAKEYVASMQKWFALSDFYSCLIYRRKTINFSVISRDN
jgi:hypothetical protein